MATTGLEQMLRQVLALERDVLRDFEASVDLPGWCPAAADVLRAIESEVSGMPAALADALVRFGGDAGAAPGDRAAAGREAGGLAALLLLSGRLHAAALGCAALHAVAHRAYDSNGEGNLADLADGHSLAYFSAAAAIGDVIPDVAVWQLEQAGAECACRCASCGVGVCLCARHGRETLTALRNTAATRPSETGIAVRQPRTGSAAAQAGLRAGDVILAAGNTPIAAAKDLQGAIRAAVPGQELVLSVRREEELTAKRLMKEA